MNHKWLKRTLAFAGFVLVCTVCSLSKFFLPNCPLFLSADDCFVADPETIQQVSPYIAEWATKPPEATEQERQALAKASKEIGDIEVSYPYKTPAGEIFYLVDIFTDSWYDWYHGYLYVHDGHDLGTEWRGGTLTKIDGHWYIYNWND